MGSPLRESERERASGRERVRKMMRMNECEGTKDPADCQHFKEGQEHQGDHSSVVIHELEHIDATLKETQ